MSEKIVAKEGIVVLAQVLDEKNANALIEFATATMGELVRDDIIPAVLGKRRATRSGCGMWVITTGAVQTMLFFPHFTDDRDLHGGRVLA